MAKDKKSKTAEKKARLAAKQSKKATQKEKKAKSKRTDDSDVEDVDLDTLLADYAKQQEQFLKVTETACEPPSARASAVLIGSPSNVKELFLFGGEYYDGALATFYNDLFIYNVDRDEWRKITSPNSPLPRSGHAWCRGGNAGGIYLFGGEFSSPKQGTFYHYNDFWRLDPSTREWTRLESKGRSPPARSGHRLVYCKQYIILFGGFQDTSQHTKYLGDLWIYDCQNFTWYNPALPPASQKPDPRSSFSFLPCKAGAILYGGYSRVKPDSAVGKQVKGGSQTSKSGSKHVVHQDSWVLKITQPSPSDAIQMQTPIVRWERRKKPANPPSPSRAGATQAHHKGRGILFGGVHDVEESEEGIESEFFDGLFAFNLDRNRFFQLTLRRNKRAPKIHEDHRDFKRDRGKADEVELLRNLAALETGAGIVDGKDLDVISTSEKVDDSEERAKLVLNHMPHPRFNAQLTVQDDILYIFGGTFEKGNREYTFDEMYTIDLVRLDCVKEIYKREVDNWLVDDSDSSSENEEDEYDSDDEDTDDANSGVALSVAPVGSIDVDMLYLSEVQRGISETMATNEQEWSEPESKDDRPHPRPFENLRDFFTRTSLEWQELLCRESQYLTANQSVKELRTLAFEIAETEWWDCREEIMAEEERQEEAGIGEVISLADRSDDLGSHSKRR